MKAKKKWNKTYKIPKENNRPLKILFLVKISFKSKREVKIFHTNRIGQQTFTRGNSDMLYAKGTRPQIEN